MSELVNEILIGCFPNVSESVSDGNITYEEAVSVAAKYTQDFYPDTNMGFIFGSSSCGRFKKFSDVDLVLLLNKRGIWKNIFEIYDGIPIHALVCSANIIDRILDFDASWSEPGLAKGLSNAKLFLGPPADAQRIILYAKKKIDDGPDRPPPVKYERLRARVTHLIVELARAELLEEVIPRALKLYEPILLLRDLSQGAWRYRDRERKLNDADFTFAFEKSYSMVMCGEKEPLLKHAWEVLRDSGGPSLNRFNRDRSHNIENL
jgi:hypothetical protein